MNTTTTLDPDDTSLSEKPGAKLALMREKSGYSLEYVASKLHLRVRVIELLEADAYAHLLDMDATPLLETFNRTHVAHDSTHERTLWQSRKQTNKAEHWVRWATALFALVVLAAVVLWWSKSKDVETLFTAHVRQADASSTKAEPDVRLTDLSSMRSLLSSTHHQLPPLELKDE